MFRGETLASADETSPFFHGFDLRPVAGVFAVWFRFHGLVFNFLLICLKFVTSAMMPLNGS